MDNIIECRLDSTCKEIYTGIWQHDYGQILRITGVDLPKAVEVQFSLRDKGGDTLTRIGTTVDGVTEVKVPDSFLKNENCTQNYLIYAWIYVTDDASGNTEYQIILHVKSRPKPEEPSEEPLPEPNIFHETVEAVNASADRAETAEKNAKASETEAGKYAASASESATAAEKTKEDALREVGEKKQEAIEAIQEQEETSVGKITTHTDDEIKRIQNQTVESKGELKQTIADADASKKELNESIQTAGDTKKALDKSTELAGTAKAALDTSIREAGEAKTALNGSAKTAGEMQETLNETAKQAGALDTSLNEKIETGTQLNEDITSSGEKAIQDIQNAGSEQLGKMQAVAEEFTADREQVAINKKDIDSLKEEKVDQKELENYALKDEIPTVPVQSVNGKTGAVQLSASEVGALPNSTKIPANTSDLTNNSGFITKTVTDLANYYLKTEVYTQEEIDNKLSAIPKFAIEVVSTLPTANISETTVYLIASGNEEHNLYTEYIYVDGQWEYLGKQTVDLTNYVKRAELSNYYLKSEMDSLLTTIRNSIPTQLSQFTEDSTHRTVTDTEKKTWNAKSNFSGAYGDLTGKPTIPTKTSQLTNDSNFVDKSVTDNLSEEISDLDVSKVEQSDLEAEVENQLDGAKADIVTQVLAQLGGMPVFGTVDDNNKITLTSMLADGDYVMVYENDEGTLETICEFTVGNGEATVTTYEVDIASVGYTDNARWSVSSGEIRTEATGYTAINLIPFERASGHTVTIKLEGITWKHDSNTAILMHQDGVFDSVNGAMYLNKASDWTDTSGFKSIDNGDGTMTIIVGDSPLGKTYDGFKLVGLGSGANAKVTITIE